MKSVFALPLIAALAAGLAGGCSRGNSTPAADDKEKDKPAAQEKAEPSMVTRGTNGEVILHLEAASQRALGMEVVPLAPASLSPEVKGFGRVMDVSPLAALAAELTTVRAAVTASQAELKRLKTLAEQNNASERALQAAEAAAVRDQALLDSARLRLMAGWGAAIAEKTDLPEFIHSLSSLESALLELDVPAGQPVSAQPAAARLVRLDGGDTIPAQLIGPSPAVDPQMQGHGYLLLVKPNEARLAPGREVTGYLSLAGQERAGVLLPRAAIVRYNGYAWVYRQTAEESFERVQVELDTPLEKGWFVAEPLKPQDKVVTTGAQMLLSAELNKGGGE